MNDEVKKNLLIGAIIIGFAAFVYNGINMDEEKSFDIDSSDISLKEKLLVERGKAKNLDKDELSKIVEAKTSPKPNTPKKTSDEEEKKEESKKEGSNDTSSNDPLCEEIRKKGGDCEVNSSSNKGSKDKKTDDKRQNSLASNVGLPSSGNKSDSTPPETTVEIAPSRYASRTKLFGNVSKVEGASRVSDVRVIKAGCTMLAQLESGVTVTSETRKGVTFRVRGPLFGCQIPRSFSLKLLGEAKLNSIQKGISVSIKTCTSAHTDVKSATCSAAVQSISVRGGDLEGEIYDQSGWSIIWDTLLLIVSAPTLGKLTETASSSTSLWSAETTRRIAEGFSTAMQRTSDKINKAFEGREISVKQGTYVKIKILEDFVY